MTPRTYLGWGGLLLCLLGLGSFYTGFFLTRIELKNQSQCTNNNNNSSAHATTPHANNHSVCNFPAAYSKCILVVIDALRLDFVLPQELSYLHESSSSTAAAPVYLNRLVTLRHLLEDQPNHTFISRFDADPPTTTMQRLKGLTVGGLPTFIDIKDDVASEAISEDNILAQLQQRNRRVTFMGDDTWVKLFPQAFTKQFPFESFNVKDLDTLDNGVIDHLMPQVHRGDYDLLIAHFLGVDHAGHRYGPNHAEMTRKLVQMDDVLDLLIRRMPRDALLLVIGDHGMTEDGNHGGASMEERSTAIFAYSPGRALGRRAKRTSSPLAETDMVQQVDLASTLALLLDFPIPFGNLGFFIPELIGGRGNSGRALLERAVLNAQQILDYFDAYPREIVPDEVLHEMRSLLMLARGELEAGNEVGGGTFTQLQLVCRKAVDAARLQWTQFDLRFMLLGMVMGLAGVGMMVAQAVTSSSCSVVMHWPSVLAWSLGLAALTSNSYINAEASVSVFCLQTLVLLTWGGGGASDVQSTMAQLVLLRLVVPWGELTRANGYEVVPQWHLLQSAVFLLAFVGRCCTSPSKWSTRLVVGAQAAACFAFYWGTAFKASFGGGGGEAAATQHRINLLAQAVFLVLWPVGAVLARRTLHDVLAMGVIPLSMIIGPTAGMPMIAASWYMAAASTGQEGGVWLGVRLALVAQAAFFASGHLCDFSALRITAPYVGFETFDYYRGVVMLSLETFGAHLVGLALLAARTTTTQSSAPATRGFLLVFASRAVVTMFFVCFARRHLMVWAIFAPKFIFDAAALLACAVFAAAFELVDKYGGGRTGVEEEEAEKRSSGRVE